MKTLKQAIRALIAQAHYSKCESFDKCKCKSRCVVFVPSAKLYDEVLKLARKEVEK